MNAKNERLRNTNLDGKTKTVGCGNDHVNELYIGPYRL